MALLPATAKFRVTGQMLHLFDLLLGVKHDVRKLGNAGQHAAEHLHTTAAQVCTLCMMHGAKAPCA